MSANPNWTKSLPQKLRKERAQPSARSHRGILEKKKDYKFRSQVAKDREQYVTELKEQARNRNPNEFNFKMVSVVKPLNETDIRIIKDVNVKDRGYINLYASKEKKEWENLQTHLFLNGQKNPEENSSFSHVVFLSDEEEIENFDKSKYFDTLPEFQDFAFNRPTKKQLLENRVLANDQEPDWEAIVQSRKEKEQEIDRLKKRMELISNLQSKVDEKSRKLIKRRKGFRQK